MKRHRPEEDLVMGLQDVCKLRAEQHSGHQIAVRYELPNEDDNQNDVSADDELLMHLQAGEPLFQDHLQCLVDNEEEYNGADAVGPHHD